MFQLNLKAQFSNEKNSIKLMMKLRDKLATFKDIENVSFSQNKNDDSYYINIVSEYKTDLNEVLSKLENNNVEDINKESYVKWSSRNKIDNDSSNTLSRER